MPCCCSRILNNINNIGIIALVALIDGILTWWGRYINIGPGKYDLTLELLLGYVFYPVAFLLGVPRDGDLLLVARLIGIKVVEVNNIFSVGFLFN